MENAVAVESVIVLERWTEMLEWKSTTGASVPTQISTSQTPRAYAFSSHGHRITQRLPAQPSAMGGT